MKKGFTLSRVETLRRSVEAVTNVLAERKIRVTQKGSGARVERNDQGEALLVNIPSIPDNASEELIAAIQGFIDHEVAHILFTDGKATVRAFKKGADVQNTYNLIEDARIEMEMRKRYLGSGLNLDTVLNYYIMNRLRESVPEIVASGDPAALWMPAAPLIFRIWGGQSGLSVPFPEFWDFLKPITDAIGQDLIDRCRGVSNSSEALDLAEEIVKRIKKKQKEQEQKQEEKKQKEQQKKEEEKKKKEQPEEEKNPGLNDEEAQEQDQGEPESSDGENGKGEPKDDTGESDEPSDDSGESDEESSGQDNSDSENGDSGDNDSDEEDQSTEGKEDKATDRDEQRESSGQEDNEQSDGDESDAPEEEGVSDDESDSEQDQSGGGNDDESPDSEESESSGSERSDSDENAEENEGENEDEGSSESDPESDGEEDSGEDDGDPEEGDSDSESEDVGENGDGAGDSESDENSGESSEEESSEEEGEGEVDAGVIRQAFINSSDMADEVSKLIKESVDAANESADYTVYTRDYDQIGTYEMRSEKPGMGYYMRKPLDQALSDIESEARAVVGPLQKTLERLVKAKKHSRFYGGQRSGRINSSGLYRLKVGDTRVFRRKEEIEMEHTAVTLLVDCSGSMASDDKQRIAFESAFALAQVLDRIGVASEVLGFSTADIDDDHKLQRELEDARVNSGYSRVEPIAIHIFKDFAERFGPQQQARVAEASAFGHHSFLRNNIDGESVLIAAHRLAAREESKKILIVLSDGYPNGWQSSGAVLNKHLKASIKRVSDAGIDVLGIGIMTDAVRSFYPESIVVRKVAELPEKLIGYLKNKLVG